MLEFVTPYSILTFVLNYEKFLPPSVHPLEPTLESHFDMLISKYWYRKDYTSINGPFTTEINIGMQIFVALWYWISHLKFKFDLLIRHIYDVFSAFDPNWEGYYAIYSSLFYMRAIVMTYHMEPF